MERGADAETLGDDPAARLEAAFASPRDGRFVAFALRSGILDGARARLLALARARSPAEPIEALAVREAILSPEEVQRITAFAIAQVEAARQDAVSAETFHPDLEIQRGGETDGPTVYDVPLPESVKRAVAKPEAIPVAHTTAAHDKVVFETTLPPSSEEPGRASAIEQRFGAYEILGEIARGGMGVVYRARREGEERVVALKMLLHDLAPSEMLVRRFEREARAGTEIDHPGIVKVFDSGSINGRLFFTMEFVEGSALTKLLPKLDRTTKVTILARVARAVHAAHEKGYVHRDLKPHNVLVAPDLVPKVADFGIAKALDRATRLTATGEMLGTISYMSPEQAGGEAKTLDRRSDVFSLGSILYEMITGSLPFRGRAQSEVVTAILRKDPPDALSIDPTCPRELAAIAEKALEKDPDRRFPTALALALELEKWLLGEKPITERAGAATKLRRWGARQRLAIGAALGVIAIAAVAAGAGAIWQIERSRASAEGQARAFDDCAKRADALFASLDAPGASCVALRADLEKLATELTGLAAQKVAPANDAARARLDESRALVETALGISRQDEVRDAAAEPALAKLFARAPCAEVRLAYARVLALAGKLEEERLVLASVDAGPLAAPSLELRGLGELELDAPGAAAATFEKALALEPGRARAKVGLARALVALGRGPDALALLGAPDTAVVTSASEEPLVRAEALVQTDPGGAIAAARELEHRSPNDPELSRRIAELDLRLERGEEAIAAFSRALELAKDDARCLAGRAEGELLAGDASGALADLERAAAIARPRSHLRARIRAREVRLHDLSGDHEAAVTVAKVALHEKPGDVEVRLALALGAADRGAASAAPELLALEKELGDRRGALRARAARARLTPAPELLEHLPVDDEVLAARAALASGDESATLRQLAHTAFVSSSTTEGAKLFRAAKVAADLATRFANPQAASARRDFERRDAPRRRKVVDDERARADRLAALAQAAAPWAGAPSILRARLALDAGKPPASVVADLEGACRRAGDDATGLALLAQALIEADEKANATRAEALLGRALARSPASAPWLALRARALAALGRTEDALAAARASLDVDHTEPATWALAAKLDEALGRAEDAAAARREAADRAPETVGANLYESGQQHLRNYDLWPESAFTNYMVCQRSLYIVISGSKAPIGDPFIFLGRAYALDPRDMNDRLQKFVELGNFDFEGRAAEYEERDDGEALRTAAALRVLVALTEIATRRTVLPTQISKARVVVERALAAEPGAPWAIGVQGLLYALEGRPALAEESLERATRYLPDWALAEAGFTLIATQRGKAKDVVLHLALLRQQDPLLASGVEEIPAVRPFVPRRR